MPSINDILVLLIFSVTCDFHGIVACTVSAEFCCVFSGHHWRCWYDDTVIAACQEASYCYRYIYLMIALMSRPTWIH